MSYTLKVMAYPNSAMNRRLMVCATMSNTRLRRGADDLVEDIDRDLPVGVGGGGDAPADGDALHGLADDEAVGDVAVEAVAQDGLAHGDERENADEIARGLLDDGNEGVHAGISLAARSAARRPMRAGRAANADGRPRRARLPCAARPAAPSAPGRDRGPPASRPRPTRRRPAWRRRARASPRRRRSWSACDRTCGSRASRLIPSSYQCL